MDLLDGKIIKLLEQDASRSSAELAEQLNTSPATVRRRIRKLLQSKILRVVAVVNHDKVGLPLTAVIALHVAPDKLDSVAYALLDRPEVTWISTTTGRSAIIFVARFASTSELSDFNQKELAHLEGVRDSETFICLKVLSWRQIKSNTPNK